jgi:hypothetical protein
MSHQELDPFALALRLASVLDQANIPYAIACAIAKVKGELDLVCDETFNADQGLDKEESCSLPFELLAAFFSPIFFSTA